MLKEFGAVFWMDASIRMHTSNFSEIYERITENGGLLLFKKAAHSNFAVTHRKLYQYFPTDNNKQKRVFTYCACGMLIYNTKETFHNILWWWFMCTFDKRCHAPMPRTICKFDSQSNMNTFGDCHKWDQSSINILLSNYHAYNISKYGYKQTPVTLTAERWSTNYYTLRIRDSK